MTTELVPRGFPDMSNPKVESYMKVKTHVTEALKEKPHVELNIKNVKTFFDTMCCDISFVDVSCWVGCNGILSNQGVLITTDELDNDNEALIKFYVVKGMDNRHTNDLLTFVDACLTIGNYVL